MSSWNFTASGQPLSQPWKAIFTGISTLDSDEGYYAQMSAVAAVAGAVISFLTLVISAVVAWAVAYWTAKWTGEDQDRDLKRRRMERAAEMSLFYGNKDIQIKLQKLSKMVYRPGIDYVTLYNLKKPSDTKPLNMYGIPAHRWLLYAQMAEHYTSPHAWDPDAINPPATPPVLLLHNDLKALKFEGADVQLNDQQHKKFEDLRPYIEKFYPFYHHLRQNAGEHIYDEDISGAVYSLRGFWDRIEELHKHDEMPKEFLDSDDRPWLQRTNNFRRVAELFDIANWFHVMNGASWYIHPGKKYTDWPRPSVYSYIEMQWSKVRGWKPAPSIIFAIMEQHRLKLYEQPPPTLYKRPPA